MLNQIKIWNEKYDLFSFFSDFIFVFGVLVLGWSPVLLILLFIIDTAVMLLFTVILFHKESKDIIKSIGFVIISPMFIGLLFVLYMTIMDFVEEIEMDKIINTDPTQIINSYILPIILVSSTLNHYAAYGQSLQKMKEGTYSSTFIKHFFLRLVFIMAMMLIMVFCYIYLNAAIVVSLIIIKALLRLWNKKYRTIV